MREENMSEETPKPQKLDEMDLLKLIAIYEQERRVTAEERELQARYKQVKSDREDNTNKKRQIYALLHDKYNLTNAGYVNFETGEITSKPPAEVTANA
jgi:hypothetical protein